MSRKGALGLTGAAMLGLVALAALPSLERLGRRDDTPVARVVREDFVRRVYAEGYLKAVDATPITAPVDVRGILKIAWLAPDGSRVREGDVIVRFDPTEMEKNLEDGHSDRATAEQKTTKRAIDKDATLQNLELDAGLAELELEYAEEFQSKDPEIFSRSEIIESEVDQKLAVERRESAETSREIQTELASADLQLLAIEKKKAELKIDEAEQSLRSLEITAPHDGIVVFQRDWRGEIPQVGQSTWAGHPLAEIPNLERMEAEVFVLEADAGGLEQGARATLVVEARPDRSYEATVKKVDALAKPKVRWVPVQYFGVTLELERTDPELMKPGQRVRAALLLDEQEDVLVLPREAVFEDDGKKLVYRREGWSFEPVEVVLGTSALGRVVVEDGVDEGDLVALQDPTRPERDETADETGATGGVTTPGGAR